MIILGIILGLLCIAALWHMTDKPYCHHYDKDLRYCPVRNRECQGLEITCKDVRV